MRVRCDVCGQVVESENWRVAEHEHKFGLGAACYGSHMPILEIGQKSEKHPIRHEVGTVVYILPFNEDGDTFEDLFG